MINHGGGKLRSFVIGMHRPGFGLLRVDRSAFETDKPVTQVEIAADKEDPLRPFARSYFRIVRLLSALDKDGDLVISAAEIELAPMELRRLDLNKDGKLSAEECGFLTAGNASRADFMAKNPVLAALDADHDGLISATEMAHSAALLKVLDLNADHALAPYEVLPNPAVSLAAAMMNRFDPVDSGVISIQGLAKDDPDVGANRLLLEAADRNRDGVVSRGELVIEMANRQPNWVAVPKVIYPATRPDPR